MAGAHWEISALSVEHWKVLLLDSALVEERAVAPMGRRRRAGRSASFAMSGRMIRKLAQVNRF